MRRVSLVMRLRLKKIGESEPYVLKLSFECAFESCSSVTVERFSRKASDVENVFKLIIEGANGYGREELESLAREGGVLGVFVGRLQGAKKRNTVVGIIFRDENGVYAYTIRLTKKEYREHLTVLESLSQLDVERSLHDLLFGKNGVALRDARRLGKEYAEWRKSTVPVRLPFYSGKNGVEKWSIAKIAGGRIFFYRVAEIGRKAAYYSSSHYSFDVLTRLPPGTLLYHMHLVERERYTEFVRVAESGELVKVRHRVRRRVEEREVPGLGRMRAEEKIFEVEGYGRGVYYKCYFVDGWLRGRVHCDMIDKYLALIDRLGGGSLREEDLVATTLTPSFGRYEIDLEDSESKLTLLGKARVSSREYWREFYGLHALFGRILVTFEPDGNALTVLVPVELKVFRHRSRTRALVLAIGYQPYRVTAEDVIAGDVKYKAIMAIPPRLTARMVALLPIPDRVKQDIVEGKTGLQLQED